MQLPTVQTASNREKINSNSVYPGRLKKLCVELLQQLTPGSPNKKTKIKLTHTTHPYVDQGHLKRI